MVYANLVIFFQLIICRNGICLRKLDYEFLIWTARIKEFVQPKISLNNSKFLIWKERGRGEREGGGAGRSAIFKVRLGLGETDGRDRGERQTGETEGRDRGVRQRYREI